MQENGDCDNDGGGSNEGKLGSEEVDGEDDEENEDEETSGVATAGAGAPINDGFGVKKVRRGSSKKLETGLLNQIMGGDTKSAKRS